MKKYAITEEHQVLSPEAHQQVTDELKKVGKASVKDLTDEEKRALERLLDNS